jgi:transcriptional regulator with XRE-family HTH domain
MGRARKDIPETLSEQRLKQFLNFRTNLKTLRGTTDLSAEQFGKAIGFPKYHRITDLEYGRAKTPTLEEVQAIAKYFNVSIDDILYKTAKITFEP